jgi:hypothetical protein
LRANLRRRVGAGDLHAHHAIQICLPIDLRVRFRRATDAAWEDFDGANLRPDEPHPFDGCGGRAARLFAESETEVGRVFGVSPVRLVKG